MKTLLLAGAALSVMSLSAFADTYVLGMKGPGAGNPFWAAVEAGAMEKGKELGVEVRNISIPTQREIDQFWY